MSPKAKQRTSGCCAPKARTPASELARSVALLKALADETRLEIVRLLARASSGELCACELEEHFELSQPTISHHLRVLRQAGVVRGERRGTWVHYTLAPEALDALERCCAELRR